MKFFDEVNYSEFNFFGRLGITLSSLAIFSAWYMWFYQMPASKDMNVVLLVILSAIMLGCAALVFILCWAVVSFLVTGLVWIATGNFDAEICEAVISFPFITIAFICKFIFGDWNRFYWRKKNEHEKSN